MEFVVTYRMILFTESFLSLFLGSFEILKAFALDLKKDILALNEANKNKEDRREMKNKLFKLIQFHSTIKGLAKIKF